METLEKIDLRKASHEELCLIYKQILRLKQAGCKETQIELMTGMSRCRVNEIWHDYQRSGKIPKPAKRGRKAESGMLLMPEQEREIQRILIDKTPNQLKMNFMLWTRAAVCELIKQRYDIELSLRVMSNYLKRWGMTCQRPTKRAYFQDNVKVEKFKKEAYPAIKARAETENVEIYWGDETGINNREHYQRGYAPKGKPPVMLVESKRESVNMISAINNYGTVRFMLYETKMTQERFIEFMERLIADAKRKVFFIVDNLKVHHGKETAKWLAEHKDQIELFFIPPYSPELNPDEYLNHALKLDVYSGIPPRTKADITTKATRFMQGLQAATDRVKAFFKHKNLAYQNV